MKNIIFLLFLTSLSFHVKSQDYSEYYYNCISADSLNGLKDYTGAITYYEKAFNTVEFAHYRNLIDAYYCSLRVKNYSKAYEYGKSLLQQTGKSKFLNNRRFKEFKKSIEHKNLKDSSTIFMQVFKDKLLENAEMIAIIDSLYYVDQRIIRNNWQVRGNFKIKKKDLPKNLFELDERNRVALYELIEVHGFPSEQKVGIRKHHDAMIIIHHNLRLAENEKFHPEIIRRIKQGEYNPHAFSFWYEQFQVNVKGTSFFYFWDNDYSTKNIDRINKNRRTFFLKEYNPNDFAKRRRNIGKS